MKHITAISFDADDTLWHTENLFQDIQARMGEILSPYATLEQVQDHFHETEVKNVKLFGYGVKGFTLSMIETAIDISDHQVSATNIREMISLGKRLLEAPLDVFDGVDGVLKDLKKDYRLFIITKGDMLDQTNKIEKSNLSHHFERCDVLQEKDTDSYSALFDEYGIRPENMAMIGNSLRSDIIPILDLNGLAVHIPYHLTAHFEKVDEPISHPRLYRLDHVTELPAFIENQLATTTT